MIVNPRIHFNEKNVATSVLNVKHEDVAAVFFILSFMQIHVQLGFNVSCGTVKIGIQKIVQDFVPIAQHVVIPNVHFYIHLTEQCVRMISIAMITTVSSIILQLGRLAVNTDGHVTIITVSIYIQMIGIHVNKVVIVTMLIVLMLYIHQIVFCRYLNLLNNVTSIVNVLDYQF